MKNTFIILAFTLIGMIVFASIKDVKKEGVLVEEATAPTTKDDCITITLSCGETYEVCDHKGSTKDLIVKVMKDDIDKCP